MTIRWTRTALRDLESVHSFVSEFNVTAAISTVAAIESGITALKRYPEMGRSGRVPGTRELIIPPYVVAYRTRAAAVEILAILHGARRWTVEFRS